MAGRAVPACRARAFLCPSARAWRIARWEGVRSTTTTPLPHPRVRRTHVNAHLCACPRSEQPRLARCNPPGSRVSASRDRVHHTAACLGGVVRAEREIQHTCLCTTRDVRDEQPQEEARLLERPSSPPRSRPASSKQARCASFVVSHLEGRRAERRLSD